MSDPLDDGVDEFGTTVGLSDGWAVVVAEGDGAFVFEAADGEWVTDARLRADGDGEFGRAVALDGATALVGAPLLGEPTPAYLFDLS